MSRPAFPILLCLALAACGAPRSGAPELSQEERMMQFFAENQPGEEHGLLAVMEGTYSAQVTSWQGPDAPPTTEQALAENRMILGGRFLETRFRMDMGELGTFEGRGLLGYDTNQDRYQGFWIDSWGTYMAPIQAGRAEGDGRTLVFEGEAYNPLYERVTRSRTEWRVLDRRTHEFDMWEEGDDGELFQVLHIVYTRI